MKTEHQAAKMLLNKGVRVPIPMPLLFRLIGIKTWKLTVKAPTAYQLIRIAEYYLQMQVDPKSEINTQQAMKIYLQHGFKMAKITAVGLLNSRAKEWQINWLAHRLTKHLAADEMVWIFQLLILHSGVEDFITTIKSIGETRLTKPMNLSPEEKMS